MPSIALDIYAIEQNNPVIPQGPINRRWTR
jgi:hypothetical protein